MDAYVLSRAASTDDRPTRVLGVRFSLDDAKALALDWEKGDLHGQKWSHVRADAKAARDPRHWTLSIVMENEISSLVYRIDKFVVPTPQRDSVLHEILDISKVYPNPGDVTFTEEECKALSSSEE